MHMRAFRSPLKTDIASCWCRLTYRHVAAALRTTTPSSCYFVYTTPPDYFAAGQLATSHNVEPCFAPPCYCTKMYPCMPCWSICNRSASPMRCLCPTSCHAHTGVRHTGVAKPTKGGLPLLVYSQNDILYCASCASHCVNFIHSTPTLSLAPMLLP